MIANLDNYLTLSILVDIPHYARLPWGVADLCLITWADPLGRIVETVFVTSEIEGGRGGVV